MLPYNFPFYPAYHFPAYSNSLPYLDPLTHFYASQPPLQTLQNLQVKKEQKRASITAQYKESTSTQSPPLEITVVRKTSKKPDFAQTKSSEANASTSPKTLGGQFFELGQQKEGRNANSNLLRMFFRRLELRLQNDTSIVERIIKKYDLKITGAEFVSWLEGHRVDFRNYIRVPTIKKLFMGRHTTQTHAKLLRILLKDFLNGEALPCYMTSRKIKKEAMVFNYRSIRTIFNEIQQHPGCARRS